MPDYKIRVGNVEIISLSDGPFKPPASSVFLKVTEEQWKKYPGFVDSDGILATNLGAFVLRSDGNTIVIDTGAGPGLPGKIPQELKDKGVDINDVSLVALTHLHSDHVGWNITAEGGKPRPTFPNATYWVPKGDWDYFNKPEIFVNSGHIRSQVLPLQDLGILKLIEGETSITSEITSIFTPGHTPGHTSYVITSQGQKGYILGDVVNFPFQVQETDWEISFDSDHALAQKTREAMLDRLEKEGATVGCGHFMPPSFGKIVRSDSRRYWQGL